MHELRFTRRHAIASAAVLLSHSVLSGRKRPATQPGEPIIDIHQHTNYSGRTDEQLLFHQQRMGVSQTILLPAGTPVNRPSTHDGTTNGLQAQCGGNETVVKIARIIRVNIFISQTKCRICEQRTRGDHEISEDRRWASASRSFLCRAILSRSS